MEAALREMLVDGAACMGIALDTEGVARFATLLSLLQTWGSKINLTTHLESREIVVNHFLDSIAGAPLLFEDPDSRIVDLGAGAGFPSFPLKFALPNLHITMIESVRKKVAFCREVIRATGSAGIDVICARSEELGREEMYRHAYEWAVSRALGSAADVLKLALPFLVPGGRLVLYKGIPAPKELDELDIACQKTGASWSLREIVVPYLEARRSLIVLRTAER